MVIGNSTAGGKRRTVQKTVIRVKVEEDGEQQKGNRPPSDSWSWRKYGQKPIKGSPYPRGYYKCSSCKGCSAKKQVERCKADGSVLIVTYTSSHNHPSPDQPVKKNPSKPVSPPTPPPTAIPSCQEQLPVDHGNDFFDELEELVPISSSVVAADYDSCFGFFEDRMLLHPS